MQIIEHLDQFQPWGYLSEVLQALLISKKYVSPPTHQSSPHEVQKALLTSRPIPGFILPPQVEKEVNSLLHSIFNSQIDGRSIEQILNGGWVKDNYLSMRVTSLVVVDMRKKNDFNACRSFSPRPGWISHDEISREAKSSNYLNKSPCRAISSFARIWVEPLIRVWYGFIGRGFAHSNVLILNFKYNTVVTFHVTMKVVQNPGLNHF